MDYKRFSIYVVAAHVLKMAAKNGINAFSSKREATTHWRSQKKMFGHALLQPHKEPPWLAPSKKIFEI